MDVNKELNFFVKIKKEIRGRVGSGGIRLGVRVDLNEELNFL